MLIWENVAIRSLKETDYLKLHFNLFKFWGANPHYDTCVFKASHLDCFSSPKSKWVPVRAVMVLVIDLAYFAAQGLYTQQGAEMVKE